MGLAEPSFTSGPVTLGYALKAWSPMELGLALFGALPL